MPLKPLAWVLMKLSNHQNAKTVTKNKKNKKGKIYFVIYIAGFFFLKFFCYEVIVKQKINKRSSNYYLHPTIALSRRWKILSFRQKFPKWRLPSKLLSPAQVRVPQAPRQRLSAPEALEARALMDFPGTLKQKSGLVDLGETIWKPLLLGNVTFLR